MTVMQYSERDITALALILNKIKVKGTKQAHYLAAAGDMLRKGERVEVPEEKEEGGNE